MLIKNIKILFLLVAISIFNAGCSSVKEAFDPQRKNGSEEFLVEKKAPLSMPPNFNELPTPTDDKQSSLSVNKIKDLVSSEDIELKVSDEPNQNFENSVLKKIKK